MTSAQLRNEWQNLNNGIETVDTEFEREAAQTRMEAIINELLDRQDNGEADALNGLWG